MQQDNSSDMSNSLSSSSLSSSNSSSDSESFPYQFDSEGKIIANKNRKKRQTKSKKKQTAGANSKTRNNNNTNNDKTRNNDKANSNKETKKNNQGRPKGSGKKKTNTSNTSQPSSSPSPLLVDQDDILTLYQGQDRIQDINIQDSQQFFNDPSLVRNQDVMWLNTPNQYQQNQYQQWINSEPNAFGLNGYIDDDSSISESLSIFRDSDNSSSSNDSNISSDFSNSSILESSSDQDTTTTTDSGLSCDESSHSNIGGYGKKGQRKKTKSKSPKQKSSRGGQKRRKHALEKPLEIKTLAQLDSMAGNDENYVWYFYMPGCPHCIQFDPLYNFLAKEIHNTNSLARFDDNVVPIIMAKMDGPQHQARINAELPGLLGSYPSIVFKRGDGSILKYEGQRDYFAITQAMSQFFGDPTLSPEKVDLSQITHNENPEYVIYVDENKEYIPRFVNDDPKIKYNSMANGNVKLNPYYIESVDGSFQIDYFLKQHPELLRYGFAIDTESLGRSDIVHPTIFDKRNKQSFSHRDAIHWLTHYAQEKGVDVYTPTASRDQFNLSRQQQQQPSSPQYQPQSGLYETWDMNHQQQLTPLIQQQVFQQQIPPSIQQGFQPSIQQSSFPHQQFLFQPQQIPHPQQQQQSFQQQLPPLIPQQQPSQQFTGYNNKPNIDQLNQAFQDSIQLQDSGFYSYPPESTLYDFDRSFQNPVQFNESFAPLSVYY